MNNEEQDVKKKIMMIVGACIFLIAAAEMRGESPSTPDIAGLQLEELHALRNVSAVYMASP